MLNTWVSSVHEAWQCATLAWEADREAVAVGYGTEMREYEAAHPRPCFRDFLVGMAGGAR